MQKKSRMYIDTEDVVYHNKFVWFTALNFNGLFCVNSVTGDTKSKIFPNEQVFEKRLYASLKLVGDKIYCIPFHADSIAVYDIKKDEFEYIVIDKIKADYKKSNMHFMGVERYKDYLFIFPVFCSCILCLNLNTHEIKYLFEWKNEAKEYFFDFEGPYFRKQIVIRNSNLYIPFYNANAVLELNGDSLESKIHKIGEEASGYSGICDDGKHLWLCPSKLGNIVSWDIENKKVSKFDLTVKNSIKPWQFFLGIAYFDKRIVLYFNSKGELFCKSENIIIEKDFSFVKEEDNKIFCYQREKGILTIIDRITNNKVEVNLSISRQSLNLEKIFEKGKIITEFNDIDIQQLLYVTLKSERNDITNSFVGEKIYTHL